MESVFYTLLGLLGFGFLVFFHELGHYIMARKEGMEVEAFSIGFGKPLIKWKFQGVDWQIGMLPFGGYVKIKGMGGESEGKTGEQKGCFFAASPLSRLKVALAGPVVNIVLAFIFFSIIWLVGGRTKAFSDNTKIVGYVELGSKLDRLGLKPGDRIEKVGEFSIHNFSEFLESAVTAGDNVRLKGMHVDQKTGRESSFDLNYSLKLDPDDFKKSISKAQAVLPANYLIAQKQTKKSMHRFSGSPLADFDLQDQDRLVWVDGQIIYSSRQLHDILDKQEALVTIRRADQILVTQVPRILEPFLYIPAQFSHELADWTYELGVKSSKLYLIPYIFDKDGRILEPIQSDKPTHNSLQKGDQILAIDGKKMSKATKIIEALQNHKVSIILQRGETSIFDWKIQDEQFEASLRRKEVDRLTHDLGMSEKKQLGDLHLLTAIKPKSMLKFPGTELEKKQLQEEISKKREAIVQIRDPDKRKMSLAYFDNELARPMLGIAFSEKLVQYNPTPIRSFIAIYQSTFRMLKSLVVGNISPKFLSGPVGMMQVMHRSFGISIKEGIFWLGLISLNLGILNLLPIPVLDGGYIFISMYEIASRKKLGQKTLQKLMLPFFVLIIFIFIFSTFHDLSRLWQSIT